MRRVVLATVLPVMMAISPWLPGQGVASVAAAGPAGSVSCSVSPTGPSSPENQVSGFNPTRPQRLIDTRDGTGGLTAPVAAGCVLRIDTALIAEIPAEAHALSLSVTSVDAARLGYLTVYPCAAPRPGTSNINNRLGVAAANNVVVALDSTRAVCIFSYATTNVVVDLFGWFGSSGLQYVDVAPVRALDTRSAPRPDSGAGRMLANTPYTLPLAGVWVPAEAEAVVANLTVASPLGPGFLIAYPCGTQPPLASNVNFLAVEDRAGSTMVGLGPAGDLCLLSNVDVHVVVDISAYFEPARFGPKTAVQPSAGVRLIDSRNGTGGWTTPMAAGEVRSFDPTPTSPGDSVYAASLNVIATEAAGAGHLRVFPCSGVTPLVSSLNFPASGEATNLITVSTGRDGLICVFASVATQVVIDEFATVAPEVTITGQGLPTAPALAKRLAITGATPFPEFDAAGLDYAMICPTGGGDLTVDAKGVPLTDVAIDGVPTTTIRSLHLATDGLMRVKFTRGTDVSEYTFRCLPSDFPPYTIDRPGSPQPGWYLGGMGWSATATARFIVILDNRGAPIWYKRTDNVFVLDVKPWGNGNLAWTPPLGPAFGLTPGRGYRITALDGTLVDELNTVATPTDHHDLIALPNGGHALITYVQRNPVNLTALGAGYFSDDTALDNHIQELSSTGTLEWEWDSKDHFNVLETTFPQRFNPPATSHNGAVDLLHINSIDRQSNGDYIVSARHLDSVFRISRATGKVLWKLGGTAANLDFAQPLTIFNDPLGGPKRPHDARLGADGVLTIFDNQSGTLRPPRVVAYQLDETNFSATMLWQRTYPNPAGLSFGLGSARRNPDGSLVISWGVLQPMLEELDAQGHRLFAVTDPAFGLSYRFIKAPTASFDREQLLQGAGGTAQAP